MLPKNDDVNGIRATTMKFNPPVGKYYRSMLITISTGAGRILCKHHRSQAGAQGYAVKARERLVRWTQQPIPEVLTSNSPGDVDDSLVAPPARSHPVLPDAEVNHVE